LIWINQRPYSSNGESNRFVPGVWGFESL